MGLTIREESFVVGTKTKDGRIVTYGFGDIEILKNYDKASGIAQTLNTEKNLFGDHWQVYKMKIEPVESNPSGKK